MPRLVAYKHSVWTGRIVRVQHDLGAADIRIDGVWFGHLLVGREVGTRRRYTFHGGDADRGVCRSLSGGSPRGPAARYKLGRLLKSIIAS